MLKSLRHRAMVFLGEAERFLEEGEYDLACFTAGQAAQLYLKYVFLRLFGETPPYMWWLEKSRKIL